MNKGDIKFIVTMNTWKISNTLRYPPFFFTTLFYSLELFQNWFYFLDPSKLNLKFHLRVNSKGYVSFAILILWVIPWFYRSFKIFHFGTLSIMILTWLWFLWSHLGSSFSCTLGSLHNPTWPPYSKLEILFFQIHSQFYKHTSALLLIHPPIHPSIDPSTHLFILLFI